MQEFERKNSTKPTLKHRLGVGILPLKKCQSEIFDLVEETGALGRCEGYEFEGAISFP